MFTFQQWLNDFLVKAAGHKYIKRIPYQSGGRLRYRYIYNVTHTHAGKHVLDPDHMKVGTKLMLDATAGKEVHGHITDVSGNKVTFEYDDGPRKGEVVTMTKTELATELDKVHGISDKLSTARAKQKAVVDKLKERGASDKQIAREQRRLDALGEAQKRDIDATKTHKALQSAGEAYVDAIQSLHDAIISEDKQRMTEMSQRLQTTMDTFREEMNKELQVQGATPQQQAKAYRELSPLVWQIINNPIASTNMLTRQGLIVISQPARELNDKLKRYQKDVEDYQTALQERDEDFKTVQAYNVDPAKIDTSRLQSELDRVQDVRARAEALLSRYPMTHNNYKLENDYNFVFRRIEDAIKQRIESNRGKLDAEQLTQLKRGDTFHYEGKVYKVRSKTRVKGLNAFRVTFDAKDGSGSKSFDVYPEGTSAGDTEPFIYARQN